MHRRLVSVGGFLAPAGTADEIIARLNREVLQVLTQSETEAKMTAEGSAVVRTTPQEFGRFVQGESRKYGEIVREAKIELQ